MKQSFLSDFDAVGFNLISNNKTFVAINGSDKGFQSKNDLIIDITEFSGEIKISISLMIKPKKIWNLMFKFNSDFYVLFKLSKITITF